MTLLVTLRELMNSSLQNSLAGYLTEAKNSRDALVFIKFWGLTWAAILKFITQAMLKLGPLGLIRTLIRNPWILTLLRVNGLARRLVKARTGIYHDSICMTVHSVAVSVLEQLRSMLFFPDLLVINEDLVPYDIARAMGLKSYLLEAMGIVLPIIDTEASLKYIDEAENAGINPDACSLPKATVGMVLMGHMPKGVAIVSSNMPCDAGAASYAFLQKAYDLPIYRLDVPYNFYNERAENLFARDLMGMITWLEQHTPGRMDWDRMREICRGRNHMLEMETELWDAQDAAGPSGVRGRMVEPPVAFQYLCR
jgi:hypothetical protein